MQSPRAHWSHLAAPAAVLAAVVAILGVRLSDAPVDAYGELGAEWIEHFERVRVAQVWGYDRGLGSFAVGADGAYPPLLHVLTVPVGGLGGHHAEAVVWTGALWLLLLAIGLGLCARGLAPGRPGVVAAAVVGGLLMPAACGAASRYYYDLPMTALLWLAAGLLLTLGRRWPVAGGALAGIAAAGAALVKWSALPFAAPLLLGAVLSAGRRGEGEGDGGREGRGPSDGGRGGHVRGRVLLVVGLAVGLALPAGGYLAASTRSWTEMMGTFVPDQDPVGAVGAAAMRTVQADPRLQAPDRSERSGGRLERLGWYSHRLVFAVWSPLGLLVMLPLAGLWAWRRGPGGWLVGLTIGGHLVFVVLAVPPLDERFVLPLAPALGLAAALGWGRLPDRWRLGAGCAAVAAGLWIAADFHLGEDPNLDPRTTVGSDEPIAGLGLTSSWERRGWGRADRRRPARLVFREALWEPVDQVDARRVGIIGGPLIDPFGDTNWWRYRALLGEVQGTWDRQGGIELVELCGPGGPHSVDVVLASDSRVSPIDQPWCPVAGPWQAGQRIPAAGHRVGAVVWLPAGATPPAGSSPSNGRKPATQPP